MVDRADLGFFGAVWRVGDFCQQLNAGSVYLQLFLRYFCASKENWEIGLVQCAHSGYATEVT